MISYKISIHKQISFGMHCLSKLNLFHNTSFSMKVNFRLEKFLNFDISHNYSFEPDGIYQRAASVDNIHTLTLSSLREGYKKNSVESVIMISPLSLSTVPPPLFCNTIIALGLVIARPCGELHNSRPAGRRDKTTPFYSKWANIQQKNYKITENAQHNSVNNNVLTVWIA